MPAVEFFVVVIALHIMCVVIAFGSWFSYPLVVPLAQRSYPRAVPAVHSAQRLLGQRLFAPFGGLLLLFGIYLASHLHVWGKVWVGVPLAILVALLAAGGIWFGPTEIRCAELAQHDIDAAGPDGAVTFSAEYRALSGRLAQMHLLACVGVLIAVYFMVVQPFN